MVAFAVGGLLGDTLFHLLPEIFLGEGTPDHVRFVMVEPNRNLLLGVAIMVGFVTFVAMDKSLRIATGGEGHNHGHDPTEVEKKPNSITSGADKSASTVRSRKKENGNVNIQHTPMAEKETNASVKLAGYLNLMYTTYGRFQELS